MAPLDVSSLAPALGFAFAGGGVAVLVGAPLGAIAGARDVPGRRVAVAASSAVIAAPPAFWWIGVTRFAGGAGAVSGTLTASVVAGTALAAIPMLLVLAGTREISANAYEAARLSLGPARRTWVVLLPLLRPAILAAFLLTTIVLLGESEIPFLFGFRTSMTDVVTTFARTFDAGRTVPLIAPLVLVVFALALLMLRPLLAVLLPGPGAGTGVIRKAGTLWLVVPLFTLPALAACSLAGYARAAAAPRAGWPQLSLSAATVAVSIAEPVLCALAAIALAVLIAYPVRRSPAAAAFAVAGLLLFCVPTAVTAIAWIGFGQALGGIAIDPAIVHVSRMLGLGLLGFVVAYGRVRRSLDDAALLVPVSPIRRAATLILPLLRASLSATSALIAALIFSDRDVASLLLRPGESRLMLNLYLLSANAPSALIGATALVVFAAAAACVALAAAGPALLAMRRRA